MTPTTLTTSYFLAQLQQRVSKTNAKLLLDQAKIKTGVQYDDSAVMETEMAKNLCLMMIKQGGPCFQVGQSIYKEYLM